MCEIFNPALIGFIAFLMLGGFGFWLTIVKIG